MLPVLQNERFILRAFRLEDAAGVVPLIGARGVAATTLRIPHPYSSEDFTHFVNHLQNEAEPVFALTLRPEGSVIGAIGLRIDEAHRRAELGYWIGTPYWARGFATEAAAAMLRYGFEDLQLHRIFAEHFAHNPASGRVLAKIGMRHEGCHRGHVLKWGEFVDAEQYGILREEWGVTLE